MGLEDLAKLDCIDQIYSNEDLKKKGISLDILFKLEGDLYQLHSRRKEGFLGGLVLNFLHREGILNGEVKDLAINVSSAASSLGADILSLLDTKDNGESVAREMQISGKTDYYIPINLLHLCTPRNNETNLTKIATEYSKTKSPPLKERAVILGEELVKIIAHIVYRHLARRRDLDDLIQDGYLGFMESLESFDSERGVKFETFAGLRIKGAMIDGVRGFDNISRYARNRYDEMAEFTISFIQENLRPPNIQELQSHWEDKGYPVDSWDNYAQGIKAMANQKSLNKTVFKNNDRVEVERADVTPSKEKGVMETVYDAEFLQVFERDLLSIPSKYRPAIRSYLLEGVSMKECGEIIGDETGKAFSESRISQVINLYVREGSFFERTRKYLGKNGQIKQPKDIKINVSLDEI